MKKLNKIIVSIIMLIMIFVISSCNNIEKKIYTINYFSDDGELLEQFQIEEGSNFPRINEPIKLKNEAQSFVFKGWDYDNDGTEDVIPSKVSNSLNLYPIFKVEKCKYIVRLFDKNGDIFKNLEADYLTEINLEYEELDDYKENNKTYTFIGWDSNNDGEIEKSVTVEKNMELSPVFIESVDELKVTYYDEAKNNVLYVDYIDYGGTSTYKGTIPYKMETNEYYYRFLGWDKELNNIKNDINVYPLFEEIEREYSITFVSSDGSILKNIKGKYNDVLDVSEYVLNDYKDFYFEYTFIGWDLNEDGVADELPTKLDNSYLAIPLFDKKDILYTITIYKEDEVIFNESVSYGYEFKISDHFVENYYFTLNGIKLDDNKIISITENTNLYLYKKTSETEYPEYEDTKTVVLNVCGLDSYQTKVLEEPYELKLDPIDGYSFDGFYKDIDFKERIYEVPSDFTGTYDIYAKYSRLISGYSLELLEDDTYKLLSLTINDKDLFIPDTINGKNISIIASNFLGTKFFDYTSIHLPKNLKKIETNAFTTKQNIKEIWLDNVELIEKEAFSLRNTLICFEKDFDEKEWGENWNKNNPYSTYCNNAKIDQNGNEYILINDVEYIKDGNTLKIFNAYVTDPYQFNAFILIGEKKLKITAIQSNSIAGNVNYIEFPNTIERIETYGLRNISLRFVEIDKYIKYIGAYALPSNSICMVSGLVESETYGFASGWKNGTTVYYFDDCYYDNDILYGLKDEKLHIIKAYFKGQKRNLRLDYLDDYPIVEISENVFENYTLGNVIFGENFDAILANAFKNSTIDSIINLSEIVHVTSNCFYGATINGEKINDKKIAIIDNILYKYSDVLTDYEVPDNVKVIANWAFTDSKNLMNIDLNNVITIGSSVFKELSTLKNVSGEYVRIIYNNAFSDCKKLESFNFTNVEYIDSEAFLNDNLLNNVLFNTEKELIINDHVFKNCTSLSNLQFNCNIKTLGAYSFENIAIESIYFNNNIIEVGEGCFYGCDNLKQVYFSDFEYKIIKRKYKTVISERAFEECDNLEILRLGNRIDKLCSGVVRYCPKLMDIYLPKTITYIYNNAFYLNDSTIRVETLKNIANNNPNWSNSFINGSNNKINYGIIYEDVEYVNNIEIGTYISEIEAGSIYDYSRVAIKVFTNKNTVCSIIFLNEEYFTNLLNTNVKQSETQTLKLNYCGFSAEFDVFVYIPEVNVTIESPNGTIVDYMIENIEENTVVDNGKKVTIKKNYGEVLTLRAIPNDNYDFSMWDIWVDNKHATNHAGSLTYIVPNRNVTIKAIYLEKTDYSNLASLDLIKIPDKNNINSEDYDKYVIPIYTFDKQNMLLDDAINCISISSLSGTDIDKLETLNITGGGSSSGGTNYFYLSFKKIDFEETYIITLTAELSFNTSTKNPNRCKKIRCVEASNNAYFNEEVKENVVRIEINRDRYNIDELINSDEYINASDSKKENLIRDKYNLLFNQEFNINQESTEKQFIITKEFAEGLDEYASLLNPSWEEYIELLKTKASIENNYLLFKEVDDEKNVYGYLVATITAIEDDSESLIIKYNIVESYDEQDIFKNMQLAAETTIKSDIDPVLGDDEEEIYYFSDYEELFNSNETVVKAVYAYAMAIDQALTKNKLLLQEDGEKISGISKLAEFIKNHLVFGFLKEDENCDGLDEYYLVIGFVNAKKNELPEFLKTIRDIYYFAENKIDVEYVQELIKEYSEDFDNEYSVKEKISFNIGFGLKFGVEFLSMKTSASIGDININLSYDVSVSVNFNFSVTTTTEYTYNGWDKDKDSAERTVYTQDLKDMLIEAFNKIEKGECDDAITELVDACSELNSRDIFSEFEKSINIPIGATSLGPTPFILGVKVGFGIKIDFGMLATINFRATFHYQMNSHNGSVKNNLTGTDYEFFGGIFGKVTISGYAALKITISVCGIESLSISAEVNVGVGVDIYGLAYVAYDTEDYEIADEYEAKNSINAKIEIYDEKELVLSIDDQMINSNSESVPWKASGRYNYNILEMRNEKYDILDLEFISGDDLIYDDRFGYGFYQFLYNKETANIECKFVVRDERINSLTEIINVCFEKKVSNLEKLRLENYSGTSYSSDESFSNFKINFEFKSTNEVSILIERFKNKITTRYVGNFKYVLNDDFTITLTANGSVMPTGYSFNNIKFNPKNGTISLNITEVNSNEETKTSFVTLNRKFKMNYSDENDKWYIPDDWEFIFGMDVFIEVSIKLEAKFFFVKVDGSVGFKVVLLTLDYSNTYFKKFESDEAEIDIDDTINEEYFKVEDTNGDDVFENTEHKDFIRIDVTKYLDNNDKFDYTVGQFFDVSSQASFSFNHTGLNPINEKYNIDSIDVTDDAFAKLRDSSNGLLYNIIYYIDGEYFNCPVISSENLAEYLSSENRDNAKLFMYNGYIYLNNDYFEDGIKIDISYNFKQNRKLSFWSVFTKNINLGIVNKTSLLNDVSKTFTIEYTRTNRAFKKTHDLLIYDSKFDENNQMELIGNALLNGDASNIENIEYIKIDSTEQSIGQFAHNDIISLRITFKDEYMLDDIYIHGGKDKINPEINPVNHDYKLDVIFEMPNTVVKLEITTKPVEYKIRVRSANDSAYYINKKLCKASDSIEMAIDYSEKYTLDSISYSYFRFKNYESGIVDDDVYYNEKQTFVISNFHFIVPTNIDPNKEFVVEYTLKLNPELIDSNNLNYVYNSRNNYSVFSYYGNNSNILIPDTYQGVVVDEILTNSFNQNIDNLYIGKNIIKIDDNAFTKNVHNFIVDSQNQKYKSINPSNYGSDSSLLEKDENNEYSILVKAGELNKDYYLYSNIKTINRYAISNSDSLECVIFNSKLENIYGESFINVPNITFDVNDNSNYLYENNLLTSKDYSITYKTTKTKDGKIYINTKYISNGAILEGYIGVRFGLNVNEITINKFESKGIKYIVIDNPDYNFNDINFDSSLEIYMYSKYSNKLIRNYYSSIFTAHKWYFIDDTPYGIHTYNIVVSDELKDYLVNMETIGNIGDIIKIKIKDNYVPLFIKVKYDNQEINIDDSLSFEMPDCNIYIEGQVYRISPQKFDYEVINDGIKINKIYIQNSNYNILIPEYIDSKPVVEIGSNAYGGTYTSFVSEITLPKTLKRIDNSAFAGAILSSGTQIYIPENVEYIGSYAFKMTYPVDVTYIVSSKKSQNISSLAFHSKATVYFENISKNILKSGYYLKAFTSNDWCMVDGQIVFGAKKHKLSINQHYSGDVYNIYNDSIPEGKEVSLKDYINVKNYEMYKIVMCSTRKYYEYLNINDKSYVVDELLENGMIYYNLTNNDKLDLEFNMIGENLIIDIYFTPSFETDESNFETTLIDDKLYISGYNGKDYDVALPKKINQIDVYGIKEFAFVGKTIKVIHIPSTYVDIRGGSFYAIRELKDIKLLDYENDDQRYKIIDGALYSKSADDLYSTLVCGFNVTNPSKVISNAKQILNYAMVEAYTEKILDLSNVINVGNYAFMGCRSIEEIILANNTIIYPNTFKGCINITSIDINKDTPQNDSFSYEYKSALAGGDGILYRKYYDMDQEKYILDGILFTSAINIDIVKIREDATILNDYLFQSVKYISKFEISSTSILKEYTFIGCENLLLEFADGDIDNLNYGEKVYLTKKDNKFYIYTNNICYMVNDDNSLNIIFSAKLNAGVVEGYENIFTISNSIEYEGIVYTVTRISDYAFSNSKLLSRIIIDANILVEYNSFNGLIICNGKPVILEFKGEIQDISNMNHSYYIFSA